jgi:hypothetical protein
MAPTSTRIRRRGPQIAGRLRIDGDRQIADTVQHWLGLNPFATERKRTAA